MKSRSSFTFGQVLASLLILLLMAAGCSHSNSAVPTDPGLQSQAAQGDEKTGSKAIWGFWDVTYDQSRGFITTPMRDVQYTVNVNQFLQPPAGSLSNMNVVIVNDTQLMSTGRVIVDVSLTHPLPANPEYAGFDVLGIFMQKGGLTARHDSNVRYAQPGVDAILSNADGYTRWMNKGEFPVSGVGGYTEGAMGTKGVNWTATVNPYKYFADGLSATNNLKTFFLSTTYVNQRGVFKAGSTNTRRYDLTFHKLGGVPDISFQYAVVASWIEPLHIPPSSVPGDFPEAANIKEPIYILADTTGSTTYWNSSSDNGGNLTLTLEIFDEGARTDPQSVAGQITEIIVESPNNFIPGSNMRTFTSATWTTSPGSTLISEKFTLDCGAVTPQGPNASDNPILVAVKSINGSYDPGVGTTHPSAPLRAFQRFQLPLGGAPPILPPGNVTGFQASDGDPSLTSHQVKLTWDNNPDADTYTLERYNYNTSTKTWNWESLFSPIAGQTSYLDGNARYSGPADPIQYRIEAENSAGSSPSWSTDTGYPKKRGVWISFWCVANDNLGNGAVVPWSTALADYTDATTFWNQYGFDYVMKNSGTFFWITDQQYLQLTGTEDQQMHDNYGKAQHPESVNVYYVQSAYGSNTMAYTIAMCPGSQHTTTNIFIVMAQDARGGGAFPVVLAHESGHAITRFWDMYLLDTNGDDMYNDGTDCSIDNWCSGPSPYTPPMYCDEAAAYSGDLMWYSYSGQPTSYYTLSIGQYIESSTWMRGNEGSYPPA